MHMVHMHGWTLPLLPRQAQCIFPKAAAVSSSAKACSRTCQTDLSSCIREDEVVDNGRWSAGHIVQAGSASDMALPAVGRM